MGKETENIFKQLNEFMKDQASDGLSESERSDLIRDFISDYNEKDHELMTPDKARTAEDYMELAEQADTSEEAVRYAKKALKLNPDDLDAELFIVDCTSENPLEALKGFAKVKDHGDLIMERDGLFDEENIGHFWGLLETRPYMRARYHYMRMLLDCGMARKAAEECEDMLRLCEGDSLGVRYALMHIYALLEDEADALSLYHKYHGETDTQMLLPLSMIYFKKNDPKNAKKYLDKLRVCNKDTRRFIKAVCENKGDTILDAMGEFGYIPNTMQEYAEEFMSYFFVFDMADVFFFWANEALTPKKKTTSKKKK